MSRNSILVSALILAPSILAGKFLLGQYIPAHYAYMAACAILGLAVLDFLAVIFIEPYQRRFSKLTIPAILAAMSIIFLFVAVDALNRFFEEPIYKFITPFNVVTIFILYVAIYCEKNVALKSYLGINSLALVLLWNLGIADQVSMPF